MNIHVSKLVPVEGHVSIRAVVEVHCQGLVLRGLKLEETRFEAETRYRLIPPGRKIQSSWQTVFEFADPGIEPQLRRAVVARYHEVRCRS
jgi:hypothetical protein